ncbi:MAG: hypothetical protein KDI45_15685, partial [Candidatus Accumulibacter sp.]|nr:hypothetical protein [Accumulibacter sp.]
LSGSVVSILLQAVASVLKIIYNNFWRGKAVSMAAASKGSGIPRCPYPGVLSGREWGNDSDPRDRAQGAACLTYNAQLACRRRLAGPGKVRAGKQFSRRKMQKKP